MKISAAVALVLSGGALASCALVAGLGQFEKVDCVENCSDASSSEAGDVVTLDVADAGSDTGTTVDADDGGCNPECVGTSPFCDTATRRCVPCLPAIANSCADGFYCSPLNGSYTCLQGCETVADCTADGGAGDGGDAGDAGSTLACCNHRCVDTSSDNANCGVCGTSCGSDAGTCCNGTCTDTLSSVATCGSCTTACSTQNVPAPTCGSGACNGACAPLKADCDSDKRANGCETDVSANPDKCGGCTKVCSSNNVPVRTCASGQCNGACAVGTGDCDNDKLTNGCETNLTNTAANCGACGSACSSNHVVLPSCNAAVCNSTCNTGYLDCDNDKLTNGCECGTGVAGEKQCGPGGSCVGYVRSSSPQAFINACTLPGALTGLASTDDGVTIATALPFAFTFWGTPVTNYWISTNGVVGFDPGAPNSYYNAACPLPNGVNPSPAIYAYFGDLYTRAAGVCVGVSGSAPNRKFVLTWSDAQEYLNANAHVTMSVILNETTNVIDVVYQTISGLNALGAIGLQGSATLSTSVQCNATAPTGPFPFGYRFTP